METIKATVENLDEKHFIKIEAENEDIKIPMREMPQRGDLLRTEHTSPSLVTRPKTI